MRRREDWFVRFKRVTVTQFSEDPSSDEFYNGYHVRQCFSLNRDPEREIVLSLTPDQAEEIAKDLLKCVEEARRRSSEHVSVTKREEAPCHPVESATSPQKTITVPRPWKHTKLT